jgi:Spermine/spermidine synthase domain
MDMLSHRNPPYLNTDHDPIRDGESVKLRATKPIKAGDEIYTSYNFCADCSARKHNYGTPEILRDYGFVEDYPQRWYFQHPRMSFDILPVFEDDGSGSEVETGQTRVKWSIRPATRDGPRFLREQRHRLRQLQQSVLRELDADVPVQEWDVVSKFVDAMVKAYGDALESLHAEDDAMEDLNAEDLASCDADGTCHVQVSDPYRDLLVAVPEVWGDNRPHTCDTKRIYDFDNWATLDTIESPYQTLGYAAVPANQDDMCFDLDDVVQICASYRPHYHEMMVHFAAQFVDKVRRVVFVGGGDSMLLHEALKYGDLELVVGLELDQVVPRNSFRYFGTQPHFDDPRVQWWFGDATKSLMMLPSEYFGSFDLVLVDLSETVQALSVTDELNVMEALALLVKPNGVLVQNEYMHFLEQSSVFRHSLHVHFDSVPIVCSQSLILASNGIDFLRDQTTDHGVETLYDLLDEPNLRYDIVRDYQKNDTNPHHCSSWSESVVGKNRPGVQLQSPGILLVVDVDGVSISSDPNSARERLAAALQSVQGIDFSSHTLSSSKQDSFVITFSLTNGYLVARAWPDRGYCAFDIHFWSLFHLQEAVRSALTSAMVGKDGSAGTRSVVSSYRIVASGVFGADSWQDDETLRGPQRSKICQFPEDTKFDNPSFTLTADTTNTLLRKSIALVPDVGFDVLVLCGSSLDDCKSVRAIKEEGNVGTVQSVQPCVGLRDDMTYDEMGPESMLKCEKAIKEQMTESGLDSIRLLVLDSTAPYSLAQIVARMFSSEANVERWLDDSIVVEATVLDNETWRKTFVDRFRTHVFDAEPVFTFDATLSSENSRFDFVVTSSGDDTFADRFVKFTQILEKDAGLVSNIRRVRAGEFAFQHEFEPDQVRFA